MESFALERSLFPVIVGSLPRLVDPWALAVFWAFQFFDVAWNELLEVGYIAAENGAQNS